MVREEGLWFPWAAMGGKRNRQKRKVHGEKLENETLPELMLPRVMA